MTYTVHSVLTLPHNYKTHHNLVFSPEQRRLEATRPAKTILFQSSNLQKHCVSVVVRMASCELMVMSSIFDSGGQWLGYPVASSHSGWPIKWAPRSRRQCKMCQLECHLPCIAGCWVLLSAGSRDKGAEMSTEATHSLAYSPNLYSVQRKVWEQFVILRLDL